MMLDWFVRNRPEQTQKAGEIVFVDVALAREVIERAETSGITLIGMRGYAVSGSTATPLPGEILEVNTAALLDCETPAGASCGRAKRLVAESWLGSAVPDGTRHMVVIDLDEQA